MITQRKMRGYGQLVWTGRVLMSWVVVLVSMGLSASLFAHL